MKDWPHDGKCLVVVAMREAVSEGETVKERETERELEGVCVCLCVCDTQKERVSESKGCEWETD